MYDYSGEFSFSMGFPAKAGASGAVMIVIPNVMGICTWSPRLDKNGNSARGVRFCRLLTERYRVHQFDRLRGVALMAGEPTPGTATPPTTSPVAGANGPKSVAGEGGQLPGSAGGVLGPPERVAPAQRPAMRRRRHSYTSGEAAREAADANDSTSSGERRAREMRQKKDLTLHKGHQAESQLSQLAYAALKGDIKTMQTLQSLGVDMAGADYDGRTALHVGAANGILASVEFLLNAGVDVGPIDRWGDNPITCADRAHHVHTATLLRKWGAQAKADGLRAKFKRAKGKLLMAVRLGIGGARQAKKRGGGSMRKPKINTQGSALLPLEVSDAAMPQRTRSDNTNDNLVQTR